MKAKKVLSLVMIMSMLAAGATGCQKAPAKDDVKGGESSIEQVEESGLESSEGEVSEGEGSEVSVADGEVAAPDFENPAIVIEAGDMEGIKDLASKMQNFEIEEGTVIKITGEWTKPGMTPSVMIPSEDGSEKYGLQMFFDYEQADLADGDKIEVVGYAVKGEYFMEFHVADGCMKLLDAAE